MCVFLLWSMVWRRPICCVVVCVAQMGYMSVEEHTPSLLRLRRSPGVRSWSLLVGEFPLRRLCAWTSILLTRFAFPPQLWCRWGWRRRTTAQVGGRKVHVGGGAAAGVSHGPLWIHRRPLLEELLRGRLPVCGPPEHGGLGGGRLWQRQEPDRAEEQQLVHVGADPVEEGSRARSVEAPSGGPLMPWKLLSTFPSASCSCVGSQAAVRRLRSGGDGALLRKRVSADAEAGGGLLLPPHPERHAGRTRVRGVNIGSVLYDP